MDHAHVPAVVIGGGPTGMTAAIMLGQRGTRCLVLERWPDVYPLPRAVHFDDEVFRIFAGMGLEDEVRAISRPAPGMRLTDVQHRTLAEFRRAATSPVNGYPEANMFDQPELERVLRAAIGRHPSVELRGGVEVFDVAQPPD
jgi:3-(3-hydroxy-phenyl)propionate hydroxylase